MRRAKYTLLLELPDESDDETTFPDQYEIEKAISDQILSMVEANIVVTVEDDN